MTQTKSFILLMCALLLFFVQGEVAAQEKPKKNKKARMLTVKAKLTDEAGEPVAHATITADEGAVTTYSSADGSFVLKTPVGSIMLIEANGYEDMVVQLGDQVTAGEYVLLKAPLFSSSRDHVSLPMGINISKRSTTGSVSGIQGKKLESYSDLAFSNALQGRLAGLTVSSNPGSPGNNGASFFVRGLSRGSADGALVIVDGIERPINDLIPEEIEKIEVLKDPSSKLLYGPRAANGIISVTTKRGKANTRVIKVNAEYGTMMPTRLPEYLNAYEYATLYNEARGNDGLAPRYSAADLAGYQISAGENDQRYPDADYYDYFLNDAAPFTRANLEFSGGDELTQYALVVGYTGTKGLETISPSMNDRFNVRGNIDLEITPSLSAFVGLAGIIHATNSSDINSGAFFSGLSSHRPNEYPFIIDSEELATASEEVGVSFVPPLGGSLLRPDNLYGRLMYGGSQQGQDFTGQGNFGLDLKLDKIATGLAAKAYFSFDNYQSFSRGISEDPITYGQRWFQTVDARDTVAYYALRKRSIQANQTRRGHRIARSMGWVGNLNYNASFADHGISANVSYFYYRNEASGQIQDVENTNLSARAAYSFRNKYYIEGSLAYMGSNRFAPEQRHLLSPAGGVAWILSEENFLKDNGLIDFLKVKGNFGIIGYDRATDFYLFENRWYHNGNVQFDEQNKNSIPRSSLELLGNPDLTWEKSRELNVGIEALAFNQRLEFGVDYFDQLRYDIILRPGTHYTALHGTLFPYTNYGETSNKGVDGFIRWHQAMGDFQLAIGGNFVYSKNEVLKTNEVLYPEEYLWQSGRSSDALFAFVADGLFTDQAQVDSHPFQTLGPYGVGDIRYQDLNADDLIDSRDKQMIGNTFPRTTLGVDLNLRYKGFGLFALFTSELGVDRMLNNRYYWNNGEDKYSVMTRDRWHAANNPDGTYPRLTTFNGVNNFTGSTFWMEDGSFVRLKNVEVSYTLDKLGAVAKRCKFFVRGTNLLVVSGIKDLDPEVPNGGLTDYPVLRTMTGGVSFAF